MSKDNDWYSVQIWLDTHERSQSWLADKLGISRQAVHNWKKQKKIKRIHQLAICYITGSVHDQLFN
tara:strand:- start:692 stop:889 length:198 start_codon:yes stop_codon:yes gene_type:complete